MLCVLTLSGFWAHGEAGKEDVLERGELTPTEGTIRRTWILTFQSGFIYDRMGSYTGSQWSPQPMSSYSHQLGFFRTYQKKDSWLSFAVGAKYWYFKSLSEQRSSLSHAALVTRGSVLSPEFQVGADLSEFASRYTVTGFIFIGFAWEHNSEVRLQSGGFNRRLSRGLEGESTRYVGVGFKLRDSGPWSWQFSYKNFLDADFALLGVGYEF